ncbi:hypothetical protein AN958_10011 [Leucoagaricus sp. SymC.cos]|nr:hypothetical protein AN958_10011 [Leucoagaricus sp. SymC.cos]
MDTLPAQASAVSCEHAFSSSKETSTMHRNQLGRSLFGILQFLKKQLNTGTQLLDCTHHLEKVVDELLVEDDIFDDYSDLDLDRTLLDF